MAFSERLQMLRKHRGMTQEELAERLSVSRQAVAKWESGYVYPDISNLVRISDLFHVTLDGLVKEQTCSAGVVEERLRDVEPLIRFRVEASQNTYAASMNETAPVRPDAHDFLYTDGYYTYRDTYMGGEKFAGEEAIWHGEKIRYVMNYCGRVLSSRYSGTFLKEALRNADVRMPYRGPALYQAGEFTYKCCAAGDFTWFQGYEEVFCQTEKVYECYFHGGTIK